MTVVSFAEHSLLQLAGHDGEHANLRLVGQGRTVVNSAHGQKLCAYGLWSSAKLEVHKVSDNYVDTVRSMSYPTLCLL